MTIKDFFSQVISFVAVLHVENVFIISLSVVKKFDYIGMVHLGMNSTFLFGQFLSYWIEKSIFLNNFLDHIQFVVFSLGQNNFSRTNLFLEQEFPINVIINDSHLPWGKLEYLDFLIFWNSIFNLIKLNFNRFTFLSLILDNI